MILCITSKGPKVTDPVEERFGRSPYFLFWDTEKDCIEAVVNSHADAAGGVGPRAAQVLVDRGAKVLITGNVGGNALAVIRAAGIEAYRYRSGGSCEDAVREYRRGLLERIA